MARIIPIVRKVDIVYGPLVDAQEFPEDVDVTLIEGAVSTPGRRGEGAVNPRSARKHAGVAGRLRGHRQRCGFAQHRSGEQLLQRIYVEGADAGGCIPSDGLPPLAKLARPVQDFVKVDVCLPGCPPHSKVIAGFLNNLLDGRKPEGKSAKIKFG